MRYAVLDQTGFALGVVDADDPLEAAKMADAGFVGAGSSDWLYGLVKDAANMGRLGRVVRVAPYGWPENGEDFGRGAQSRDLISQALKFPRAAYVKVTKKPRRTKAKRRLGG